MESIETIIAHNERICQEAETEKREKTKPLPCHRQGHIVAEFGYDFRDGPAKPHCSIKTCGSARPALLFKEDIKPLFDFIRQAWPEAFSQQSSQPAGVHDIDSVFVGTRITLDWDDPSPASLLELLCMAGAFAGVEVAAIEAWSKEQRQIAMWWANCRYLATFKIPCISVPDMPRHVRELMERADA